jgi:hypothetical protein
MDFAELAGHCASADAYLRQILRRGLKMFPSQMRIETTPERRMT